MIELLQSAFAEALGWSLIDSLWQTGTLWGVYSLITLNGKYYSPTARHNLAFLSILAATAWFFVSLYINYGNAVRGQHLFSISYFITEAITEGFSPANLFDKAVSLLSFFYLGAISFYSAGLYLQYTFNRKVYHRSSVTLSPAIQHLFKQTCNRLGIKRTIRVVASEKALSPFTSGVLKPMILLPLAAINQLTTSQLEAILVHELFHVKRRDYLLNLVLIFSEVILFFNPFAKILANTVRKEREHCCDDGVLSTGVDAWEYSEALYLLGNSCEKQHRLVIAATGTGRMLLLERIKRLMKLSCASPSLARPLIAFFLCLALAIFAGRHHKNVAIKQADKTPQVSLARLSANPLNQVEKSNITIVYKEKKVNTGDGVKKKRESSKAIPKKSEPPGQEKTEEMVFILEADGSDLDIETIYNTFVDNQQSLEFTLIIPEVPETPRVVTKECPAPYIPGSTFYCPVDSLPVAVKTIVQI
jgi:beta-lactamase regulating signal transducer with metallopeptidase domain